MEPLILIIPIELLSRIFAACDDFLQVVSLASACRHTRTAWLTHSPSIIWNVGVTYIRSFDDALMAVSLCPVLGNIVL